ncbi:MAG: hypothetical protein IJ706_05280 [Clostridia bacterium]|nr:hypothetical protein [Clostridia bacterium]
MKKLLFKLATAATAVAVTTGALASCGLFTVNTDRDMRQKVATVQIENSIDPDDIYKRDLAAGYVSYGYYYVQNYGYTTSATYELILNNLVNNSVIVQQSRKSVYNNYKNLLPNADELKATVEHLYQDGYLAALATDAEVEAFDKTTSKKRNEADYYTGLNKFVYDKYVNAEVGLNDAPFRFVKESDIYAAISSQKDNVNALIASVATAEDEDDAEEYENVTYTARTTPSITKEEKEEKTDEEKAEEARKDCNDNAIDLNGTKKSDFVKAYDRLKDLGVIDSENDLYNVDNANNILAIYYFRTNVNSALESSLVSVYEQGLKNDSNTDYTKVDELIDDQSKAEARKADIVDTLWKQYSALQNTQKASSDGNISGYETLLGNADKTNFVVYNPMTGYSYVSHLVIEFTTEQKQIISDIQGKENATNKEIEQAIAEYVEKVYVKDLRSSWVQSGYGVYKNGQFDFSDSYVYNTESPLAHYMGTIDSIKTYTVTDDEGEKEDHLQFYGVKPNNINMRQFLSLAGEVMGVADLQFNQTTRLNGYDETAKRIDTADFNNFEDLKFAFSIDTGNFNKYLGYVYSPISSKTQYVKAFTAACVDVTEVGVGGIKVFASPEYGLHIVMCTATSDYGIYGSKEEFKADLDKALGDNGDTDTIAYNFMMANVDLVTDQYISDQVQWFIKTYTTEGTDTYAVTKYEKAYSDLITE